MKPMKNLLFCLAAALVSITPAFAQQQLRGAQQQAAQDEFAERPKIHVDLYSIEITLMPAEHRLVGKADIQFKQLDRKNYAVFDLDRRLRVDKASIAGVEARIRQFDVDSTVEVDLSAQQFNNNPVVHLEYSGILNPEDDRHDPVLARVSDESAFLLYGGKWFPSNGLYRDKANLHLKVNAPAGWTAVTDLAKVADGFASSQPSYWGTLAAGNYSAVNVKTDRAEISVNTLRADANAVKATAEAVGKMFDYYTEKFGPPPSTNFRIVEVQGANWSAQSSVGMLLVPSSGIRKDFDADALSFAIAHQWFPMKFSVKDQNSDAWLGDGMAQFASLMYFEKTLTPAEAQTHIHTALVRALGFEANTTVRQAGTLDKDSPEYRALVQYKGAYVFRMLRWIVGDETFDKILARYAQQFQNAPVSTEAFQKLASDVAGGDLGYFFEEWVNGSGVPEFKLDYTIYREKNGYKVDGTVKQDLDLFRMPVEFQVLTDGDPEFSRVDVAGESSDITMKTDRKPKSIVIDPKERILHMSTDIKVSVVINRGEELSNEGQYNSAIDEFQKALDLDGNNSLAMFRMGEALFELGNTQAAAQQFQQALNGDLKVKWVEVWSYINRGKIFDIRSQRDRAVTEYQKAVNTGDDSYGAQSDAQKYLKEPYRRSGKPTIG
jgi:aminopeptidase N